MVTDDVGELALLNGALNAHDVVESLIFLGGGGCLALGQQRHELASNKDSVDHLVLSHSWVHIQALNGNLGACGVEVLIFEFSLGTTVHGVGPVAAKFLHVKLVGTQTNLLVGVEANANFAVLHLGMLLEPLDGSDNLGDTCLVVGAQQGSAVGHDEVLANVVVKFGELHGVENDVLLLVESDGAAGIFLHDAWLNITTAHVGGSVHVGDEAQCGQWLVGVGGKSGIEVTIVVERYLAESHLLKVFLQLLGKDHLSGG